MARVIRPGGFALAELYNPMSFRGLAKRLGPAGKISDKSDERAVFTRFDPPWRVLCRGAGPTGGGNRSATDPQTKCQAKAERIDGSSTP